MADKKKGFWSSFEITDRESCEKAIRNGGIAALVSAAITTTFGVLGFFTQSSNADLNYMLDPWILLDVVLIVVLAIFIFRKSRVASTLLLVHFVASKLIMWIDLGAPKRLPLALIFLFYYFTAMRGTYLWNSTYRDVAIQEAA